MGIDSVKHNVFRSAALASCLLLGLTHSHAQAAGTPAKPTYPSCDGLTGTYLGPGGLIMESWEGWDNFSLDDTANLKRLNDEITAHGSHLIILPIPNRAYLFDARIDRTVYPQDVFSKAKFTANWQKMIQDAQGVGVDVFNVLPIIDSFRTSARGEEFFYSGDHHWTTSGAQEVARQMARYVQKAARTLKIPLTPGEKTLVETPGSGQIGAFADHYRTACKQDTVTLKSYKVVVQNASAGLLDDSEQTPDIGVFGDSFGLGEPTDNNFVPYLEYYTKLNVSNYSAAGGGFFGAMLGYLADPDVVAHLPKFVIVPFQGFIPSDADLDAQVVSTLKQCRSPQALPQSEAGLKPDLPLVFSLDQPKPADSLRLTFKNPVSRFTVDAKYGDGSTHSVKFDRYYSEVYKGPQNIYYLGLDAGKPSTEVSVTTQEKENSVSVELCS